MEENQAEDKKWYAAFVETGHEDHVKEKLEYRFKEELSFYVLKRQMRERKAGIWQKVNRIIFPGYVLINGIIDEKNIHQFKDVPGLWKILCNDNKPLTFSQKEISFINKLISNGETLGPSTIFTEGDNVKIINGPLTGFEGLIQSIDKRKGRVKIKVSFLGEERLIDFSADIVKKT